ncbi:Ras-related protein Rab-21 [Eumeta japonica]|uniref:Ras-related protein Rab-21 n=1 Tax=Eumeta variegata TaxID=151549 RepID=A0A4C2A6R3_EUMVA|nr:Ras-related protein Rab-21 [Eumeta japonica]
MNKKLNIDGNRINLSIWDTAGQERFHALGPIYYRNSNGAILVYDITDEDSFGKVKVWVKELKRMLGTGVSLVIVGNKIDLEHERTVPFEEAESYANKVGAKHHYTSAKHNQGIEELFLDLALDMMKRADASQSQTNTARLPGVVIVEDQQPTQSSCCSGSRN